jgi:hypothetical protein
MSLMSGAWTLASVSCKWSVFVERGIVRRRLGLCVQSLQVVEARRALWCGSLVTHAHVASADGILMQLPWQCFTASFCMQWFGSWQPFLHLQPLC